MRLEVEEKKETAARAWIESSPKSSQQKPLRVSRHRERQVRGGDRERQESSLEMNG